LKSIFFQTWNKENRSRKLHRGHQKASRGKECSQLGS
jgi:hypothetical protein